jgi:hypothetical protein
MFSNPVCDGQREKTINERHIDGVLANYGFKRKEVPGNGAVLF